MKGLTTHGAEELVPPGGSQNARMLEASLKAAGCCAVLSLRYGSYDGMETLRDLGDIARATGKLDGSTFKAECAFPYKTEPAWLRPVAFYFTELVSSYACRLL